MKAVKDRRTGPVLKAGVSCCYMQADVWDVDGTGMQTVPDLKLSRKIRKVLSCTEPSTVPHALCIALLHAVLLCFAASYLKVKSQLALCHWMSTERIGRGVSGAFNASIWHGACDMSFHLVAADRSELVHISPKFVLLIDVLFFIAAESDWIRHTGRCGHPILASHLGVHPSVDSRAECKGCMIKGLVDQRLHTLAAAFCRRIGCYQFVQFCSDPPLLPTTSCACISEE